MGSTDDPEEVKKFLNDPFGRGSMTDRDLNNFIQSGQQNLEAHYRARDKAMAEHGATSEEVSRINQNLASVAKTLQGDIEEANRRKGNK